jgi:tetratricopeptide (TPR) repeat protein
MLELLNESQFDELNSYHYGKLPVEEKLLFEAKMISDPLLAKAYEEFKETLQIIKAQHTHNLRNHFNLIDATLDENLLDKRKRVQKFKYPLLIVAVLCLGLIIFFMQFNKPSPAIAFNERDLGLPVVMGAGNQAGLDMAMSLYKQNQYQQSEGILKSLQKKVFNDTLNYYIGINEYELGHFQSAIECLKKIENPSVFYQKSLYRQGLAYWQLNDIDQAKHIFFILKTTNSFYADQSRAILKKLK